jgi:hypothetical protein
MNIKFAVIIVLVGFLLIAGALSLLYAFVQTRVVKPVASIEEVVLTRPLYGIISSENKETQRLVYTAYVAGFLDAIQLEEAKVEAAHEFLKDCEGMTLGQLRDEMILFYYENPQWRDQRPANILINIIPRLKKGLSPFPSEEKK